MGSKSWPSRIVFALATMLYGARVCAESGVTVSSLMAEAERQENLRQLGEAAATYHRAAELARREARRGEEAYALARECRAVWSADQPDRAGLICEEAFRLARVASSAKAEAEALKMLGVLAMGRGDFVSAERQLRQAATLAQAAGEMETAISSLSSLSAAALEQGRAADAVEHGSRALALSAVTPGTSVRMRFAVPYNLGKALEAAGDEVGARRYFDAAARSAAETRFAGGLHHVLMDSAELLLRAGDLDGASAYYERAIAWNEATPQYPVDVALARQGRATTLEARGLVEEALVSHRKALVVFEKSGAAAMVSTSLLSVARCLVTLGRFDEAESFLARADALSRRAGLRISAAMVELERARAKEGRRQKGVDLAFEKAGRRLVDLGIPSEAARAFTGAARAAEGDGDLARAEDFILRAIHEVEQVRATVPADVRWRFLESVHETYAAAYRLRMRRAPAPAEDQTSIESAFEVVERERSRDLAEAARVGTPSAALEVKGIEGADARIGRIELQLLAEIPDARRETLLHERADAERDRMLMAGASRLHSPVAGPTIAEARARLLPGEALVVYVLDEPAAVFVLSRSGVRVARLALPPALPEQGAFFSALSAQGKSSEAQAAGEALSRALLAPVLPLLPQGTSTLLVASTGELAEIPFGVLPHPMQGDPLMNHFEVGYTPSLQMLAALRTAPSPKSAGVLVMADPQVASDLASPTRGAILGPLPYALKEGREVARHFEAVSLLEGAQATPRVVRQNGRRYGALHFATHAVNDAQAPMNSALVLAPEDASRSGWMTAREIYSLSLDASLVTLSACRSSVGPATRAAAAPTLARAFLYAGSRTVVAGLWDADDAATRDLMGLFYEQLAEGRTVGEAMANAQRTLARTRAPDQWAGFVVIGDPGIRVPGMVPSRTWTAPLIAAATGLLALFGWAGLTALRVRARRTPSPLSGRR